ncbi:unnamed protein product [Rhizophagus irregularis]|nr:unnamed protein product [Rhizophagus irregularis]
MDNRKSEIAHHNSIGQCRESPYRSNSFPLHPSTHDPLITLNSTSFTSTSFPLPKGTILKTYFTLVEVKLGAYVVNTSEKSLPPYPKPNSHASWKNCGRTAYNAGCNISLSSLKSG